jgi:hypothetical protein
VVGAVRADRAIFPVLTATSANGKVAPIPDTRVHPDKGVGVIAGEGPRLVRAVFCVPRDHGVRLRLYRPVALLNVGGFRGSAAGVGGTPVAANTQAISLRR